MPTPQKADPYAALPEVATDPYASLPTETTTVGKSVSGSAQTPGFLKRKAAQLATWGQEKYAPIEVSPDSGKYLHTPQPVVVGTAGVLNTIGAGMRYLTGIPDSIAQSHPIDAAKQGVKDVIHPVDAMRRNAEHLPVRGGEFDHPYDPKTRTGVLAPGRVPRVDFAHDVPEVLGPALAQYALAEVTMGAGSKVLKVLPEMTPAALKEGARLVGRSVLGADPALARTAVKDASEQAEKDKLDTVRVNREAAKTHADKTAEVRAENEKSIAKHTDRKVAQAALDESSKALDQRITAAEKKAGEDNDGRWDALRKKIGNSTTNINRLKQMVKAAAKSAEPVSPNSGPATLFRSILGEGAEFDDAGRPVVDGEVRIVSGNDGKELLPSDEGYDAEYQNWYGEPPPLWDTAGAASFNRLQRWYSFISDKMYGHGRVESGTWDALKRVRAGLDDAMQSVAKEAGAEKDLAAARASHQQMMEAFRDSTREDQTNANKFRHDTMPEHMKAEARAERARKVAAYDPEVESIATHIENLQTGLAALPKEAPFREQYKPLPSPPTKQTFHKPTLDIGKENLAAIEKKAAQWKSFSKRDLGMITTSAVAYPLVHMVGNTELSLLPLAGVAGYEGVTRALASYAQRPGVAEWFARPGAGEVEALSKIPGADKVKIVNGLTGTAIEAAKQRRLARLAPEVAEFLGSQNARRVADAIAMSRPKTAGDAKARIRALQAQLQSVR